MIRSAVHRGGSDRSVLPGSSATWRYVWPLLVILMGCGTEARTVIFPGRTGAELRRSLRQQYAPDNYLSYNAARSALFGTVDNNGNRVELAYTTETFPIDPARPIPDPNGVGGVNTEHTWPQSRFGHVEGPGMKTDLFHLYPVRARANADRGNKPFGEIPDSQAVRWWNGPTPRTTPPTADIDAYSESAAFRFEPEENHKGNVARAMVYFFTIYEEEPTADRAFFTPQVATLKSWHVKDPADVVEVDRGRRIERIQGNVNPFVLDPTLLDRAVADLVPVTGPVPGAGAPPVVLSPLPGTATTGSPVGVSIVSLLPNPDGADEGRESVTLGNPTDMEVDLAGWTLTDKAGREFVLWGKIPAGETRSFTLVNTPMILANRGGTVSLITADGTKLQTVSYTKQQARSGASVPFGN